ncbi:flagellar export chaperone FliS [Paenibacillus ferrarius]|uniref:Flagellar secretion chaperone FliS n=1 Tax=Paenibacillus ferrarius TaxID=1469647 RepID=A0A1V4HG08_9BACL|nr:flagellar export chaperone FliS [Paenibacillus ferrarius]OPH54561.1 flagellar export chaperone FliS [Paenibacillus ferrarius]
MNQQAQATYLRMQVNTAAPWELTTMLFSGCIKFMKQGLMAIENEDFNLKNINIKKAVDILDELTITLNHNYEIADQLGKIYDYVKRRLFHVNFKLDVYALQECIELISELRDTWVMAMKELHGVAKVQS